MNDLATQIKHIKTSVERLADAHQSGDLQEARCRLAALSIQVPITADSVAFELGKQAGRDAQQIDGAA